MTTATLTKNLRSVIKESVREVFEEELMKSRALLLPDVSPKEQKQIEKLYGRPKRHAAKTLHVSI